jgi:mono/diheme cytochrome c family protein
LELSAVGKAAWTQARNLHDLDADYPVGKLYDTITNGRSTMGGYEGQISVEDRWAIVLYVRTLQQSEYSALDDVPEELRINYDEPVKIGFESEADASDDNE